MCSKKMGRPTDSPKVNDVKVRLNDEMHKKLLEYCEKITLQKQKPLGKAFIYFCHRTKNNDNAAHRKQSVTVTTTNPRKESAKSIIAFLSVGCQ